METLEVKLSVNKYLLTLEYYRTQQDIYSIKKYPLSLWKIRLKDGHRSTLNEQSILKLTQVV